MPSSPEQRAERKRFGDRVRSLRTERGWSQEEFAHRAELHPTYVSGVERGQRNVSFDNIVKLANALDVPARELF